MKKVLAELFTSKKFIGFLVGIVLSILSKKGIAVPPELATEIVALTASYVVGQGLADMGKEKAKIEKQ